MAIPPQVGRYASRREGSPDVGPLLGRARLVARGLGDALGAVASAYLVLVAMRLGAPASVAARMVANIAVDAAVGAIPLLGDLFDAGWKANKRNLALLE